jgi:hypothetical protein
MQVLFSGRKVKVRNWLIVGKRNRYGEIIRNLLYICLTFKI